MNAPKPRILVIDDTPANLLTLGSALKNDYDLQIATSGAVGLAQALQSPPDLILLDIMMPDMDGFEVCRRLKQELLLKDVPVIFVTALHELESEIKGLELGALDYITKPIQVETARQRIRNLLDQERLRQEVAAQRDLLEAEISARKLSQNHVEKLLLEQKAMLENDLVGIVRVAKRIILWANPAFEKMLGYGAGELVGKPTRQSYPSEQASQTLAAAAYPVLALGQIFRTQTEHVRKDGQLIWVELSGTMLTEATGESLWTFVDITERQQAQLNLQRNLRFTQAINQIAQTINTSEDANVIFETATTAIGQALQVDRAMVYELSFSKRLGVGLHEWLNPQYPDITPTKAPYPLDNFIGGAIEMMRTRQPLVSQADHINPHLLADGSGTLLHGQMGIQSLLWYPFNFSAAAFHLLVVNQIKTRRSWTPEDINFLAHVGQQVTLALGKLQMLAERQRAQAQLLLSASVFASALEGIIITDTDGAIVDVNEAFSRITGYSRADVLGKNPSMLGSGHQKKEFYTNLWQQLVHKGHWYGEIWNRRKNGEVYAEMLNISTVRDADGRAKNYVALFSDITAIKEHEKELDHIAHYDVLTGLPNRILLADRLRQGMTQAVRRNQQLAVVFLDLDGFKAVNDTHGHEAGDQLLMAIARRMKRTLREGDTLARIGGDEFIAVLMDLHDSATSIPMLQRLLEAAAQPLLHQNATLTVSASLGVTFYPQVQDLDAEQLMRQADQAMYQAKLAGKNRYYLFDAVRDSGTHSHRENLDRIRQALQTGELTMYYQPKVNLRSGAVTGVEALLRWQHPVLGLEGPDQFLPLIKDHPLAVNVGEWVLQTVLTQMDIWQAQGLNLPVSVNVSARQFLHSDFVTGLRALLVRHPGIAPAALELEVVEATAMEDIAKDCRVIEQCSALGVRIALDDFGSGYSSLSELKRLPVSLLKIDPIFVHMMLETPDDLAVLKGVIGLAHAFRHQVIAEGVETTTHCQRLLQLGCELAQGFAIAQPMPASELPPWLRAWKPDPAWTQATNA